MEQKNALAGVDAIPVGKSRLETYLVPELQKNPQLLQDMMYVLLTMENYDLHNVKAEIETFTRDYQLNQNQEEWKIRIGKIKQHHQEKFTQWKKDELKKQQDRFRTEGKLDEITEKAEDLYIVHCTDYLPEVDSSGKPAVQTTFTATHGEMEASSVHVALNHVVKPASALGTGHSWESKKYVIIAPFSGILRLNGAPFGFLPEDTWWSLGATGKLYLPQKTIIITAETTQVQEKDQLLKQAEIEILTINGKPAREAETIMKEKGIKVIYPHEFKGAERLADDLGTFYGYHLGDAFRQGSQAYIRAEAIVVGSEYDAQVPELVEQFNNLGEGKSEDKYQILINLLTHGYFEPPGFDGLATSFLERPNQDEFISALRSKNCASVSGAERIRDRLLELSNNPNLKLPDFSSGELRMRLDKILGNLDIIPPNLLGAFLLKNLGKLIS